MKLLILLVLVAVAAAAPNDNHYDPKYDNFNIQELLDNRRLLCAYAKCFTGEGKCTAEGHDFKKWIPEGSKNGCAKCTEKQKKLVAKFISGIQVHCAEEWEKLNKQGDPEGKHQDELKTFLDEYSE
uniref:Chemosensory protein n=1 Tax=Semiothisa cinerearia TaxID=2249628 RepID=A0A889XL47_9NEOP|nr:chemosensory protein [Semiothisa cinerearia]